MSIEIPHGFKGLPFESTLEKIETLGVEKLAEKSFREIVEMRVELKHYIENQEYPDVVEERIENCLEILKEAEEKKK